MSPRESATRISILVRNALLVLPEPGPILSRVILPLVLADRYRIA